MHDFEKNGKSTTVTGVWRVWFEHPPGAGESQVQFEKDEKAKNTNPDHSFEIHPVTSFGTGQGRQDLLASFHDVKDFPGKDAADAFKTYERQQITIKATKTAVTLDSQKVGYNYVRFKMKLLGSPKKLDDGSAVVADVFTLKGSDEDALASKIRMVFVENTPPWTLVKGKGDGDEFEALGIPRVDLGKIYSLASKAGPVAVKRKLPYEIVVVYLKALE